MKIALLELKGEKYDEKKLKRKYTVELFCISFIVVALLLCF